jgi:hypothetical protein
LSSCTTGGFSRRSQLHEVSYRESNERKFKSEKLGWGENVLEVVLKSV